MIWSKTKKALEALLADSVKVHVQYHITRYGPGFGTVTNRGWITWDGKELVSFSNIAHDNAVNEVAEQLETANRDQPGGRFRSYYAPAAAIVDSRQQIQSRDAFDQAVERYLALSIDDALIDADPVIKALAMFDRRLGKRQLKQITIDEHTHPLVKQLYERRIQAESMTMAN